MNPARCLPTCAFDPTPNLLRVNRQGEPDPRGRFQLLAEVQPALVALTAAARAAGHVLRIESAFRSYDEQARLFATIKEQGRAARPGHSEHQLGSTIDLRLPSSAAIEWLAAHAAEHGFALSYPPDKQRITGYRPEPWHVRYIGRELAEELQKEHRTLEEHFRIRPGLGESGSCGDCPLPASRAACGEVSAAGSCSGTVLLWCYDGALNAVDCAVSGQQCGRPAGSADESRAGPEPRRIEGGIAARDVGPDQTQREKVDDEDRPERRDVQHRCRGTQMAPPPLSDRLPNAFPRRRSPLSCGQNAAAALNAVSPATANACHGSEIMKPVTHRVERALGMLNTVRRKPLKVMGPTKTA